MSSGKRPTDLSLEAKLALSEKRYIDGDGRFVLTYIKYGQQKYVGPFSYREDCRRYGIVNGYVAAIVIQLDEVDYT